MATNFPGPYGLRIYYTVQGREHKLELNFDTVDPVLPGDAYADIDVVRRGVSSAPLSTVQATLVTALVTQFASADATIDRSEVWSYTSGTFDAIFVTSDVINEAGTNAGNTTVAGEDIYTFRTEDGGILRLSLEEPVNVLGSSEVYADLTSDQQDLVDIFTGGSVPWLGRDNSYPFVFLKRHPGKNERTFKKIFR